MWEPPSVNGDMDDFDLNSGNNNAVCFLNNSSLFCTEKVQKNFLNTYSIIYFLFKF